jgi:hypothetical protein
VKARTVSGRFRAWYQIECLGLEAIQVEESWVRIVVEEGRDVTRLPVDDTRNLSGTMRVYEDVVIV